ncbi:VWA domain-containing protein [Anaerolineales bacterium HSG25]|nr:VWA domain-containing protein [Anaerolineales bacterium HSG25]
MGLLNKVADINKSPAFNLDVRQSHKYLSTSTEEQALYLLVKMTHASDLRPLRLPLNLCLVLDRSTSMRGARLQNVKQGVQQIIDDLEPDDALSVVLFSDRAKVLLPSEKNIQKSRLKSVISAIQSSGGTEMLQGLVAGIEQLRTHRTMTSINHLMFITDGQTYGDEAGCLEQAQLANASQITLTTMGIGEDWNETLLEKMAVASGGTSLYIDSPREIRQAFQTSMDALTSVVARGVSMTVDTASGIRLENIYMMTPYISVLEHQASRLLLGPLACDTEKTMLMEFRVRAEVAQTYPDSIQIHIEGDLPEQTNYCSRLSKQITVEFSKKPSRNVTIPSDIITALGKLAIFKLQEKTMIDLEQGEVTTATQRLETMATRLLNIGETELARSALLEAGRLARTGNLSAEGRKKIRYGTRSLSMLPKEIYRD